MKKRDHICYTYHKVIARFQELKKAESSNRSVVDYYGNKLGEPISIDEVKIKKGVAHYYVWGNLIAKWDGKILWLDNAKFPIPTVSSRLGSIFWACNKNYKNEAHSEHLKRSNNFSLYLGSRGYNIRPAWGVNNPYPLELDMVNKEYVNSNLKVSLVEGFLRARRAAPYILKAINEMNLEIPEEYKEKVKAKQLKLALGGKVI